MRKLRRADPVQASFRSKRSNAAKEGHAFSLTLNEYRILTAVDKCPWCGVLFVGWDEKNGTHPHRRSIDQLVPRWGYSMSNALCVCFGCNLKKQGLTAQQHRELAEKIELSMGRKAENHGPL